jgi:hypothetical protein
VRAAAGGEVVFMDFNDAEIAVARRLFPQRQLYGFLQ